MKIIEIVNGIHLYAATVSAKHGKSKTTVKTAIFADGISQARALLAAMYGEDSVVSVTKVSESDLKEAAPNGTASKPTPRVLPNDYSHALVQKALLNQMKRNALHVHPTVDDLRAAESDFEADQKRVDREYEEAVQDKRKWAAIRCRNKAT